jgi:hypothetical protein
VNAGYVAFIGSTNANLIFQQPTGLLKPIRLPPASVILRSTATKDLRLLRKRFSESQNSKYLPIGDKPTEKSTF